MIDPEDASRVEKFNWALTEPGMPEAGSIRRIQRLHQFILRTKRRLVVDHVNHDKRRPESQSPPRYATGEWGKSARLQTTTSADMPACRGTRLWVNGNGIYLHKQWVASPRALSLPPGRLYAEMWPSWVVRKVCHTELSADS